MYNLKWGIFILFSVTKTLWAQDIDWDKINSRTILNIVMPSNADQNRYHSDVVQIGDYNKSDLLINAKTSITVQQFGDYNTLFFINSFTDKETKSSIVTEGNNNIIDITGSNRISEGMQVNVKGDNKTIFMRNY
ncbi:hypothetical protein C1631_022000 [Chryseobacterium phosphatilyticum]|uniref:Curlin n=1 Tax=Chryseobacterium phosphatilyticum TaxID=475075 RepID=A0A316WR15_9FLAO|nr:hypothetical protein [Chryseobacterium phosphatilyticum]PWN63647.1 hypothetical protein C1631_022000 [Chryseobacterium phosphatilyticum]